MTHPAYQKRTAKTLTLPPVLAGSLLLLVINHLFAQAGPYGYDDMAYSRLAAQVANGTFQVTADHFTYRWVPVFGTGVFYRLFGISDLTSALLPWLATLSTVACVWSLTRNFTSTIRLSAVVFYLLSPWNLFYADKLMPDCYVALAVTGTVAVVHAFRFRSGQRSEAFYALAFTGFLWLGLLSKESVLLLTPLYAVWVAIDLIQGRNRRFWALAVVFAGIALAGYCLALYLITGNALSRVSAIASNQYLNPCSYDQLPKAALIDRLTRDMPLMLVRSGLFLLIILAVPEAGRMQWKRWLTIPDEQSFLNLSVVIALLCAWFMSTSLQAYVPLCPDIRHFLFLAPLLAPLAAQSVIHLNRGRKAFLLPLALAVAAFYLSWRNGFELTYFTALPLAFLIAMIPVWRKQQIGYVFLWILAFTPAVQAYLYIRTLNYPSQKSLVKRYLTKADTATLVITDEVQRNIGQYLLGFDSSRVRFITYGEAFTYPIDTTRPVVLLNNWYTAYLSTADASILPDFLQGSPTPFPLIAEKEGVQLYRVNRFAVPDSSVRPNRRELK